MLNSTNEPIRILLVDDHTILRSGLRLLIGSNPRMLVIGEADNREETVLLTAREKPDVIVLDLVLGEENSLDFLTELLSISNHTRVIVLTGARDPLIHERAVALGAKGLVIKDESPEVLLKAIERVHAGEVWLERSMIARVLGRLSGGEVAPTDSAIENIVTLSEREREIISLISEGLTNKAIAKRLNLSESTIHNHLTSIFNKLEVANRLELVIFAYRYGLAQIPIRCDKL
jgi:two-component system nitrate/nitrite response regulator NarL